jgi:hypothetical protein
MIPIACQPQDLLARYDNTFLYYEGDVYYTRVNSSFDFDDDDLDRHNVQFHLYSLENLSSPAHIVDPYEGVDSSSIKLGYVNGGESCIYVMRHPERRWKQGVSSDLLANQLPRSCYMRQPMFDMMRGIYPSQSSAIRMLGENSRQEVAISRDIKIRRPRTNSRNFEVYFRERLVGAIHYANGDHQIELSSTKLSWAMSPFLENIDWRVKDGS